MPASGRLAMRLFMMAAVIIISAASLAPAATERAAMMRMLGDMEFLNLFAGQERVSTMCIGRSVLGQNIPLVIIRNPDVPVESTSRIFIICRQHGNKPASTEAMLQLIRYFFSNPKSSDVDLLRQVTFIIVPMMNPDGAMRHKRRNANNADLNRDWINQKQPETRAVTKAIKQWRPHLIIDSHELDEDNVQGDFIECLGRKSGVDPGIAAHTAEIRSLLISKLRTEGFIVRNCTVSDNRSPRLAHRYFPLTYGIPTLLIESRQSGRRFGSLDERARMHLVTAMTAARCLAGQSEIVKQEVADWWKHRTAAPLASRGGHNRTNTNNNGQPTSETKPSR